MYRKSMAKPIILLVEDDPLLVTMYKTKFQREGFEVLLAGDGVEGLKLVKQYKPHLLILDFI